MSKKSTTKSIDSPPPGSHAAIGNGCLCPEARNVSGLGQRNAADDRFGTVTFFVETTCPLHAGWVTNPPMDL